MVTDASRRIPKAVLFVVATGSYRIDHPSPCTSSLACRMTRASTAAGWSAWTTAYRPATATITIATKATACTRSLGLRATPRPPSDVREDWTGPFGVKDHFTEPSSEFRATTRPGPPKAPPPTKTVPPRTAGDEIPASTEACQTSAPVLRFNAYTIPSFAVAIRFGPRTAGEAATDPPVGKNHRSVPMTASSERMPYGAWKEI